MPALSTVLQVLAKASAVILSVLLIAAFSAWALLDLGPSKELPSMSAAASDLGTSGYWLVASDGGVFNYGDAAFHGSAGGLHLNAPIVGMAATPDGGGYWLVASDGGVFNYGDAAFHGSAGGLHLNKPIVGMAATPDGGGYWLVASDGGVFNYGDAAFHGSAGGLHLNKPIVGMAATPDDGGYWLVASDGGVFNYGDAAFHGSAGGLHLNKPIVGMAATPDDGGYWLVASDGGVFNYGDANFEGSTGGLHLNKPVVGMATDTTGAGYWLVASDGGIFNYGDASFEGSTGGLHLNAPIVAVAGSLPATSTNGSGTATGTSGPWACTSSEPQYFEGSWVTWTGSTCPQNGYGFAADPVDFAGMNDPTDQLGENSEVDADMWSPVCATSSGSIVGLNDPACVTRETQVIDANSAQDWQVTVNSPTDPTGQVTTYPNARAHGYGGTVDSYTSLTQTMSVSMPNVANVSAHAMPDDYLSQPGDSNFDYEIMIQWDRVNDAPCGSSWGGAKYTVASVTTSGGSSTKAVLQMTSAPTWQQAGTNDSGDVDLYDATNDSAEPGIYSVSGSTVTLQTGTTTISPGDVLQGFQGWGVSAKDIMIDGSPWLLCDSQPPEGRGTNGGCVIAGADEGCGALVWKPAPANNPTASDSTVLDDTCDGGPQASPCTETIDLKAMFTWLETHDPPNSPYPYVEAGSSIQALTSGFEIMSTGGGYEQPTSPAAPATFASNKFTICADCG